MSKIEKTPSFLQVLYHLNIFCVFYNLMDQKAVILEIYSFFFFYEIHFSFVANALRDEGSDVDDMDKKQKEVKTRIEELIEPLSRRKQMLDASKQLHQFYR